MSRPRHHHLRTFQHTCTALAAALLFLIAATYVFRHDLYTSITSSGHTIGLIRGRIWLAHLPNMPSMAVDAWWAAHGADDRRNPISFSPWPRRETIGPTGWALALPLGSLALFPPSFPLLTPTPTSSPSVSIRAIRGRLFSSPLASTPAPASFYAILPHSKQIP